MRRPWLCLSLVTLAACTESPLTLDIIVGKETGAMSADPAVSSLEITLVGPDGSPVASATAKPGGSFDLGDVDADTPVHVEVEGRSLAGETVLAGRSLVVTTRGLEGQTLPIFVQRLGAWARPPKGLDAAHAGGCAAVLGERYLFTTGGSAEGADGATDAQAGDSYDLLTLGPAVTDRLPHLAKTLVARGDVMLVVGDDGATLLDLTLGESNELALPDGLESWADVAGGRAIDSDDGRTFLVGPTRAGSPTHAVLEVGTDFALSHHQTTAPRAGAAAAWVPGVGLVVVGGSDAGAGVELLSDDATLFSPLPFDPDPVAGAAAVLVDAVSLALVGGVEPGGAGAPTRILSPACVSACAVAELDGSAPPVPLARAVGYRIAPGHALVFGNDGSADRAFDVTIAGPGAISELPLRVPRSGATLLPTPNGALSLLGGVTLGGEPALDVELFLPE